MEEVPREVKILEIVLCMAAVILLAAGGKFTEKLRRSPKESKTK
jgi:hypothetical protein